MFLACWQWRLYNSDCLVVPCLRITEWLDLAVIQNNINGVSVFYHVFTVFSTFVFRHNGHCAMSLQHTRCGLLWWSVLIETAGRLHSHMLYRCAVRANVLTVPWHTRSLLSAAVSSLTVVSRMILYILGVVLYQCGMFIVIARLYMLLYRVHHLWASRDLLVNFFHAYWSLSAGPPVLAVLIL